jgi:SAM-dependent methyltransferase
MDIMHKSSICSQKKLPTINGEIDWDRVALNYHRYILSPYAHEMVETKGDQPCRNILLNYLHKIPRKQLNKMRVLDFGCGPGNLIPHIDKKITQLVGVDKSAGSLKIASSVAEKHEIIFESICDDIINVHDEAGFDLIISSNSILPNSREEVVTIFSRLNSLLSTNGKLLAILPSFDTTLYLQELTREENKQGNNESVLVDEEILAYADDGYHLQCYHTPQSILEETALAGLKLKTAPQKVYYPWELCRQFGYGFYPQSQQEIWDWFIVAEKA